MMDEKILKPCPFCGGKARWKYVKPYGMVVCKRCGAMPHLFMDEYEEADGKSKAIEAWNRRVSNDGN